MTTKCPPVVLASLMLLGCGGTATNNRTPPPDNTPPACFQREPGRIYLNRDAIYVANAGTSSIWAFQAVSDAQPAGAVCGSPFHVDAPPTALGGGGIGSVGLVVASEPQKSISVFSVDFLTSVLTGPLFTITTPFTPKAVAAIESFFYVANFEASISAYHVAPGGKSATEVPGSPFPAGAGSVAIAAANPGLLYVANSLSNDVSGYLLDANGVATSLPGSPYPAGNAPASVEVEPPFFPNPLGGPTLVFVANAGSNDVSVYSIANDGGLLPVPGSPFAAGSEPSSTGVGSELPLQFCYVANFQSNNISGYRIDATTGSLTPLVGFPLVAGAKPVSMAEAHRWLYVANAGSETLSVFRIDVTSGGLTPASGSPFPVGKSPSAVLYF